MIPILFRENETAFTSQGLGRLSDALNCIVTEERNGAYVLEMEYPIDGIRFSDIKYSRFIYARPADGKAPQPFEIYKIGKVMNGRCKIYAQHISYRLSHIPVFPFTAESFASALDGLVTHASEDCPFTVWTDKVTTGNFRVKVPTSFRALLGGVEGSLLDAFGTAEYEFDKFTVYAHLHRGIDRGVVLKYGKNITDLKQEENIQNTITGICPYWVDRETEVCKTLPEKVMWCDKASNFPYKRTVPVDLTDKFDTEPTDAQLREAGRTYIESNDIGVPKVSIDLTFIPLWQSEEYKNIANLERVNLCDTVTVVFEKLGISTTAKVVKTVYDVLKERYSSISVGEPKTTLAKTIVEQDKVLQKKVDTSVSFLEAFVNHATALITGGKGGYFIFKFNADGWPEELLIMDSPDEATAVNIIRLNKNGIGFSTNGGATYTNAWTIDGVFNADFIAAGSLYANLIKSGRISSVNGRVYFDLDGNEIHCDMLVSTEDNNAFVVRVGTVYQGGSTGSASGGGYAAKGSYFYATSSPQYGVLISPGTNASTPDMIRSGLNGMTVRALTKQGGGTRTTSNAGMIVTPNGYTAIYSQRQHFYDPDITDDIELNPMTNTGGNNDGMIILEPYYLGSGTTYNLAGLIYLRGTVHCNSAILASSLSVTGSKNRIVTTKGYGDRLLYSYEMPSPMFGDIGEGRLDETGECYVTIDDIFSETIRADIEYQVFLQKEGPGDLWVEKKTPSFFVVKGSPNLKFSWELKAKQTGYETERLDTMDLYRAERNPPPYESLYADETPALLMDAMERLYEPELYIESFIKEQEEMLNESA